MSEDVATCYFCGRTPEGLAGAYLYTSTGRALVRLCRSASRDCFVRATRGELPAAAEELADLAANDVCLGVLDHPRWTLCATHPTLGTRVLLSCPSEIAARHLASHVSSFVKSLPKERASSLLTMRDHLAWRREFVPSSHLDEVSAMVDTLAEFSSVLG